jgi:hypothetical protein
MATLEPAILELAVLEHDCFSDLIAALPQELHDAIFDLTFTAPSSSRQYLTKAAGIVEYKSNIKLLQVNKATRAQYGKAYFSSRTFVTRPEKDFWFSWMESLSKAHRAELLSIKFLYASNPKATHPYVCWEVKKQQDAVKRLSRRAFICAYGKEMTSKLRIGPGTLVSFHEHFNVHG